MIAKSPLVFPTGVGVNRWLSRSNKEHRAFYYSLSRFRGV